MQQKKTVLVFDTPRSRSPLLNQYYEHLARQESPLSIIMDGRLDMPAEEIINDRLDGKPPDYIYWGFRFGTALLKSADYINTRKIRMVVEVGDVPQFVRDKYNQNFEQIHVDYLTARWHPLEGYHMLTKLNDYISRKEWLKNAEIIYVPWGINPAVYEGLDRKHSEKDIAVSHICSFFKKRYAVYEDRFMARDILQSMSGKINVRVGSWWGKEYLDLLSRSKIFIVDGNMDFMVQKYLEASVCGAMLMGTIPSPVRDIFVDKVSMAKITDFSRLDEAITYYLDHLGECERIAKEGRQRVLRYFTLNETTRAIEKILSA